MKSYFDGFAIFAINLIFCFFETGHHLIGAFTYISEGARTGGRGDVVILVCHSHLLTYFETELFCYRAGRVMLRLLKTFNCVLQWS